MSDVLFRNALMEILREIEKCPEDSIQDIANEKLEQWKCGFRVNPDYSPELVEEKP